MGVSVIIPTYNSGPWVVEAVASAMAQTRLPLEILVVDDGSTDDTGGRLSPFGSRIRYIRKENGGVSSARNRGIAEARGEYLAFLDADDVWHPRKLDVQLRALQADDHFGLMGSELYDWPGIHSDFVEPENPKAETIPFENLMVRNCLVTSTILVRTRVVEQAGGFDPAMSGPEDHDFWIRVAKVAPVGKLHLPLTGYRSATPGSLSKDAGRMEAGMRMILNKLETAGEFRGRPWLRRKAWGHFNYSCGFMRHRAGENRASAGHLIHSLIGYPLPYDRADVRLPFGRLRLLFAALRG